MRTYAFTLILAALSLAACNTSEKATSSTYNDDIYYSSKDAAADKEKQKQKIEEAKRQAEEAKRAEEARRNAENNASTAGNNKTSEAANDDYYPETEKRTDKNGDTYITNNYYDEPFNYDDYYDYEYAARLSRFHNNVGTYGYYDSYYTNSYWYTGDPYYYGTSVYMGYNFWGPSYVTYSYNPSFYWYTSVGWGYDPWYHPYGFNPCYGYGYSPYSNGYANGYYNGYNNGYWNGYYDGHSQNYFNSYDNNSYYYGPRGSMTANSRVTAQPTMATRYKEVVEAETHKPFEATHGRDNNPYMKPTTVDDYRSNPKPVDGRRDNYTTKPVVSPGNPDSKPVNERPSNNGKPVNGDINNKPVNGDRPVYNDKPVNNRPENIDNKPIYNEKPVYNENKPKERPSPDQSRPQQRPVNDQRPFNQPKPVEQKPINEKPIEKPVNITPKSNNQFQAPAPSPAPRNSNSSGNGSAPPKSGPRR
jgi:hypothetical protein